VNYLTIGFFGLGPAFAAQGAGLRRKDKPQITQKTLIIGALTV
jgi:hypothetical protein